MKKFLSLFVTAILAVTAIGLTDAEAQKDRAKYKGLIGAAKYGDLGFSNTSHAYTLENDTLDVANADTSDAFMITGAKAFSIVWSITDADDNSNVSGHTLTITPQVSIDRTTWQDLSTTFSLAGSAGATATLYSQSFVLAEAGQDTANTLYDSTPDRLKTNNFFRAIVTKTNVHPEVDTVFVSAKYNVIR